MSLTLHYHPLSSFCHKALIALYENEVPFTPHLVDLGDAAQRASFRRMWPIGKFPVLRDEGRGVTVAESTIIIEYLQHHYPGSQELVPTQADAALATRRLDRLFDLYVHLPMQKIVGDRLRPEEGHDPHGVEEARHTMRTALDLLESELEGPTWANGHGFSLADCAAAPALFYANKVMPLADHNPRLAAYLERLMRRPSYARALAEARPYFHLFPA
ncbi:glutathione S-transferase family protein [Pseudoxanthomonas gei]|uniref:Glutathione S-transferase family protein n=1 Tax=Pseudoxanthomonas gei TaxID=1383030 RepID=A0ABX0AAZ1_9GAMM|nr:glutathione S-transferase family protein [Pseudoxanthomonas gei]NDK37441.1 glutathione S-transferase family protein [Pseudoxanthomonas gei]